MTLVHAFMKESFGRHLSKNYREAAGGQAIGKRVIDFKSSLNLKKRFKS